MPKIKFNCPSCKATGTVESKIIVEKDGPSIFLMTPNVQTDTPCPSCGVHLSWPGGEFKMGDDGVVYLASDGTEAVRQMMGH